MNESQEKGITTSCDTFQKTTFCRLPKFMNPCASYRGCRGSHFFCHCYTECYTQLSPPNIPRHRLDQPTSTDLTRDGDGWTLGPIATKVGFHGQFQGRPNESTSRCHIGKKALEPITGNSSGLWAMETAGQSFSPHIQINVHIVSPALFPVILGNSSSGIYLMGKSSIYPISRLPG